MKSKSAPQKLLTEVELELMNLLWKLEEGTVHNIQEASSRKLAYTSVSTMMRILEQKGYVTSRKEGRGHVYLPAVTKSSYEATALENVVERVFEGAPALLVRRLLDTKSLSKEDLQSIESLLKEKRT